MEAIGYVGSAGAATIWLPQAWRAIRLRHDPAGLAAISGSAYLIAVVFNALLIGYGATTDARPVLVAGVMNLTCALVILSVLATRPPVETALCGMTPSLSRNGVSGLAGRFKKLGQQVVLVSGQCPIGRAIGVSACWSAQ